MVSEHVLLLSTTTLLVQVFVVVLLLFGYSLKRRGKFRQHGKTMTVAVLVHLAAVLSWMIWSFVSYFSSVHVNFGDILVLATLAHATFGVLAASLGVWLVASWRLKASLTMCFARRHIMLTTITLWLTAIALGVVLYIAVVSS